MYYFVHRVKSAWLKSHALHFGEWATAFFKAKPGTNDDWQFNLCQYADEFNPDVIIHTEHLQAGLTKILRSHGKDSLRLIGNLNATKDRPTMTEALDLLEHDTHLQLMQWAQADAERFGYDL